MGVDLAGTTLEARELLPDGITRLTLYWTCNASGVVRYLIQPTIRGAVRSIATKPTGAPTNLYDITLLDLTGGGDALHARGANMSGTVNAWTDIFSVIGVTANWRPAGLFYEIAELNIQNAGVSTSGIIRIEFFAEREPA